MKLLYSILLCFLLFSCSKSNIGDEILDEKKKCVIGKSKIGDCKLKAN